jgi:molybdopterin molybdotransferase
VNQTAVVASDACAAGARGEVVPVDIASARAVAMARPVAESERLSLMAASGRILAQDVRASIDLPPFDNAAMDGYAVRLSALSGAGPWSLPVVGRQAAGEVFTAGVEDGVAIRIFTGAAVPRGFNAVAMQEDCEREAEHVILRSRPREGQNIRWRGEDVSNGALILKAGDCLTPQRLALLAGQGLAEVGALRKVRIGLISTGTELREPGARLDPGQIYNSNRVMIRAMLDACPWAEIIDYGIVRDSRDALQEAFRKAVMQCDVLVTTGGVSAGEEDHVVAALDRQGGELDVLKVAMRPGKPVKVGTVGQMLFVGLPGNPNAVLVTFRQIALPAIRAVAGISAVGPQWSAAVAGFNYTKALGRTEFVPVKMIGTDEVGRPMLEMLQRGSSARLMPMAEADGIALLPPDKAAVERGMPLRFERLG